MFKFKMLTKVLVAVLFFGQLIELNVNLCIALSFERNQPENRVRLYKSSQFQLDRQVAQGERANGEWGAPAAAHLSFASRPEASIGNRRATDSGGQQQQQQQRGGRTGRAMGGPSTAWWESYKRTARAQEQVRGVQRLESTGRFDYFGEIKVGTPAKSFNVLFDVGSIDFWLPSASCKSELCLSRENYNASESSTYAKIEGHPPVRMGYGGGIQLEGHLSSDLVVFAGLDLHNLTFTEVTQMEGKFLSQLPVDGFMGLGFGARTATGLSAVNEQRGPYQDTIFELLVKRGLIEKPIVSMYLNNDQQNEQLYSRHAGELIMGEIDPDHYVGELTYVPLRAPNTNLWEFKLDQVALRHHIGGHAVETGCDSGCPVIIETGSTYIGGHPVDVDRINRRIGAVPMEDGNYILNICDLGIMPDLVFTIGGTDFYLRPEEYIAENKISGNVFTCYSRLRALDSEQYPFWILGESFLKHHYVVFDYGEKRIGLAKSRKPTDYDIDNYDEED